ncbi:hemin uptake protein HemP [Pinisolibacter aquiterrae]|uniref:hemin uptake protein HemP n=1 Tax=Pinisolibacter aquiterrae TaxID=2815579 RepID=UPI001E3DD5DB|nr:hemin uptake protein HemP [Pinisolibacter aquiterrae]MBV5264933.1 hemin uptake protein HemP [Pinisolibacter aquiterrae]MCC8234351.1 hemin uptake protein HemP [Pinisolibacter aquiterrae]
MMACRDEAGSPDDAGPDEAALGAAIAPTRAGSRPRKEVPTWPIERLTEGGREARIRHAGAIYLLRITSNGKLILTK